MTENKRFTLEETDWSYRIRDNGAIMKIPKIVDLLNEQHETIQQLKQEIETLQEQLAHFDIGDVECIEKYFKED